MFTQNKIRTILGHLKEGNPEVPLKIFNAQLQLVMEKNIKTWNENEMMEIQTTVLSKGIYLLQIISGKGCFTERFLKD